MEINKLIEFHNLALQDAQRFDKKRFAYESLAGEQGRHFIGIAGARGTGKTVLLRQYTAAHPNSFYLSADVLSRQDVNLPAIIRALREHYGYTHFLLDEIHFLPGISSALKQIYDFLDVRLIFTSSVAMTMYESSHDLSRRMCLLRLPGFSFREYVWFKTGVVLPKLDMASLVNGNWSPEHIRAGHLFDEYLTGGILPFSLSEPDPFPLLEHIVEKVVTKDIPAAAKLLTHEIEIIRRLLRFVGRSGVDGINYSSLARNLGITKYKAEQYIEYLEKAFVAKRVFPAGTNVLREPKILLAPPYRLLYRDKAEAIGGLREDFAACALEQSGVAFHYLKSSRGAKTPDYLIEDNGKKIVVEIGGKGKGREQFKGVEADIKIVFAHREIPEGKNIPLFLLGFLT